jgi:hypothetical protein
MSRKKLKSSKKNSVKYRIVIFLRKSKVIIFNMILMKSKG